MRKLIKRGQMGSRPAHPAQGHRCNGVWVCHPVARGPLHLGGGGGGGKIQALERAGPQGGPAKSPQTATPRWSPPCTIVAAPRWPARGGARDLTTQPPRLKLGRPPGCLLAQRVTP